MTTWFTGCLHFGHKRIIELAKRPFDSVEQMNKTLISNWNSVVGDNDHVYILGDICWPSAKDAADADPEPWLSRLNGFKTIVWGNHDDKSWTPDSFHAQECVDYLEVEIEGQKLVLFHYPIDDWNGRYKGWIHLHCHDHIPIFRNAHPPIASQSGLDLGKPVRYPEWLKCNRFRVGVDACNFRPVSFEEIMAESKWEN